MLKSFDWQIIWTGRRNIYVYEGKRIKRAERNQPAESGTKSGVFAKYDKQD